MQQAAEVDLDRLVDYKTEYCSVIKKHKITGDNLTGLCPFHDDRANSFSVDLKTGMWHCFAEDEGGNFVTFYAKLNGLDTKEAYKQILEKYGALNEPQEKPKEKKPGLGSLHRVPVFIREASPRGLAERAMLPADKRKDRKRSPVFIHTIL